MENLKLLCAAVIEQAADDYRMFKGESVEKALNKGDRQRRSDAERNFLSAVWFFEGPGYEYYADALNFGLKGKEVLKTLDLRRNKTVTIE